MGCAILGEQFDLHGGGADLQFPHHENEIAQSEGASGKPPAKVWAHNGLLNVDHVKMSKSLGNFFTIREVLERYDGETIRFFMLRTHYRSPFNFSDGNLDDARNSLRRLYTALLDLDVPAAPIDWSHPLAARFQEAMNDDFGTPEAVAVLFEIAGEVNRTRSAELAGLL
jgi:cysteinyl-tRNA synthetase